MQTFFTDAQLADPKIAEANAILRTCVHCGLCTATCPTYQVLGDEADSPRGRIYLIKEMLETGRPADARTVKHIDRCLSCLACVSTCPSGVDYMHLIDQARVYIEDTYRRPWHDRLLRWTLAQVIPYPTRFRLALFAAGLVRPLARFLPDARLRAMVAMAPRRLPAVSRNDDPQVFPAKGVRRMRLALMTGCAQKALNTDINDATIRLLTRLGCDVVVARGQGCCGALTHHMGREAEARRSAAANIAAFAGELRGAGLEAIVINTSGCGTMSRITDICFPVTRMRCEWRGWRWTYPRSCSGLACLKARRKVCAWPITRPVRCSMANRSNPRQHSCCGKRGLLSWNRAMRICVVDRPGRIICCSRKFRAS